MTTVTIDDKEYDYDELLKALMSSLEDINTDQAETESQ